MARLTAQPAGGIVPGRKKEDMKKKMNLETVSGLSFFSANEVGQNGANKNLVEAIKAQPGYRRGTEMCVNKTKHGSYRLYARVSGQWMDASLKDME